MKSKVGLALRVTERLIFNEFMMLYWRIQSTPQSHRSELSISLQIWTVYFDLTGSLLCHWTRFIKPSTDDSQQLHASLFLLHL